MIHIISAGPGSRAYITLGAIEAVAGADKVVLRTARHGIAAYMKERGLEYESLDSIYEKTYDFDSLNFEAAKWILDAHLSEPEKRLAYVVSDAGNDKTVSRLIDMCANRTPAVPIRILSGVPSCGVRMEGNHRAVPAADIDEYIADVRTTLYITEIDSRLWASECKLELLEHYPPEHKIIFYGGDCAGNCAEDCAENSALEGMPSDREGRIIELCDMDRQKDGDYGHMTAVRIPKCGLMDISRYDFNHLLEIMQTLRAKCPWDGEQTHETLKQYLIEEAYEVLDAIDNAPEKLYDELGDVLLQVVFNAQIASERGEFDARDVLEAICSKMITRHEHIFGDKELSTSEQVINNWERIKMKERGFTAQSQSLMDVPISLPALMRACKVQKRAARVGFDWDTAAEAYEKVYEEIGEFKAEIDKGSEEALASEMGDLLFACVNVARKLGIEPETALMEATSRFARRFKLMEELALKANTQLFDMTFDAMNALWDEVKENEAVYGKENFAKR